MLLILTLLSLVSAFKFRSLRGQGSQNQFNVHSRVMDFSNLERGEAFNSVNEFMRVDFARETSFTYGMVEATCPDNVAIHTRRFARRASELPEYDHESMSLGHLVFNSLPTESRRCVFAIAMVTMLGNGTALLQKYGHSPSFLIYKANTKERFSSSHTEEWTDKPTVSMNLKTADTVIIYTGGPLDEGEFKRLRSVAVCEAFGKSIRGPACLIGAEVSI